MAKWEMLERDGSRLACRDFGGEGPAVLLLHGLAGHGEEWAQTASWLTARCRVVALDARGHGRSQRMPVDVSRAAHMADAAFVIDRLGLAPVAVVGQSLGGVTALLVAARRPELVRALVLVEASPVGADDEYEPAVAAVEDSLRRWPVPFATQDAARDFFAARFGNSVAADAWTSGLEERRDGWWPRFAIDVMTQTLRDAARQSYWADWDRVSCPILVVRGTHGIVDPEVAEAMIDRQPRAQLVELAQAGHDLHLDQPGEWCRALSNFLDGVDGPASNGRGSPDG